MTRHIISDSLMRSRRQKYSGEGARAQKTPGPLHPGNSITLGTEKLVAIVVVIMGRAAACAGVVQCNVRFLGERWAEEVAGAVSRSFLPVS